MDLKDLLCGIGVVIDDALGKDGDPDDLIVRIVERLERDWSLPCYKADRLPPQDQWTNLFRSAGFVLLDWKLWQGGASQLVEHGIAANVRFLRYAIRNFVPVFIFTNESSVDVADALPSDVYRANATESNIVFIHSKAELLSGASKDFASVHEVVSQNASVYTLKTWERLLFEARKSLFSDMYAISSHWPRVFWRAYQLDGVDPSLGLTQLIVDGLCGRIPNNAFSDAALSVQKDSQLDVATKDLRALIEATTSRGTEPDDDIRCGDLFRIRKDKFLLNIRPDCDCVPRGGLVRNDIDLYCIEGKRIRESELAEEYRRGHFRERADQGIVFAVTNGTSIRFRFKELQIRTFGELRKQRVGRLLHPYLTRIQQRYALYLQRQGLPSIPGRAVSANFDDGGEA